MPANPHALTWLFFALAACGGPLLPPSAPADPSAPAPDPAPAPAPGPSPAPNPTPAPAAGPRVGSCPVFPADNAFNRDISNDPVDPRSAEYLAFMGAASMKLHPDFGMAQYGQPFVTVRATQVRVPMAFTYASQSDSGPYPFPLDVPIQGGDDRHAVAVDVDNCVLYETYATSRSGSGFYADSGAKFDLRTGALRPDGWTSATASGLPIFPGMARPEEVVDDGEIRHALSFTFGWTAHAYTHPATHSAGTSSDPNAPPMGLRVRLRADFDLSKFTGASLVVLKALRKYGMFVNDNSYPGQFWSVAGSQSSRWPVENLQQLKSVPASAFEVVKLGTVRPGI
jgi:hypothetical protein